MFFWLRKGEITVNSGPAGDQTQRQAAARAGSPAVLNLFGAKNCGYILCHNGEIDMKKTWIQKLEGQKAKGWCSLTTGIFIMAIANYVLNS
jgi:hypothetical protein